MPRRKAPHIPDALLDQLLAGGEAKDAFGRDGGAHRFGAISPFRSPARKGGFIAKFAIREGWRD